MTRVSALVVAAGAGKRFGRMKQFEALRGRPVVDWALEAFQGHREVDDIVLVLPDERDGDPYRSRFGKVVGIVRGGERRQDSVRQGFRALDGSKTGLVLVHDGARPLVGPALISRVIAAARADGAAVPGVPLEDTIKEVRDGRVARTVDRGNLFRIQTPQGFLYGLLRDALETARRDGFDGTDEAMLVERLGALVTRVEGDSRNIKITTPFDIKIAEALLDA
ncbi:MAG: 2-C-methyl-D-erythritol 4-phosphate cytidylyltransferase [Candidatus Aminicenantes bacterium]